MGQAESHLRSPPHTSALTKPAVLEVCEVKHSQGVSLQLSANTPKLYEEDVSEDQRQQDTAPGRVASNTAALGSAGWSHRVGRRKAFASSLFSLMRTSNFQLFKQDKYLCKCL